MFPRLVAPGLPLCGTPRCGHRDRGGVIDPLLPVAAICGDHPRRSAGSFLDPLDRGRQLGSVSGIAGLDGVVEHKAVVVANQQRMVSSISVVGCGGRASSAIWQNRRHVARPPAVAKPQIGLRRRRGTTQSRVEERHARLEERQVIKQLIDPVECLRQPQERQREPRLEQ